MEHPFTWYTLLPENLQHLIGDHTFFAVVGALLLIWFALAARASLKRSSDPVVPGEELGTRNVTELLLEFVVVRQSDAIIGKQGRKYVPYFGTFFFFILFANLMGLLPGFGAPTSNLNTTLGLAIVSFIGYNLIGIRAQGVGYIKHFLGPMTSLPGQSIISKVLFLPILVISVAFFFVVETFSHGFRPVSLSVRLFGNMMGDHEVIGAFIALTKVVIPVAFYLMGTLVSVIQAFVFMLLSMIYVALAVTHEHEESQAHEAHPSHH